MLLKAGAIAPPAYEIRLEREVLRGLATRAPGGRPSPGSGRLPPATAPVPGELCRGNRDRYLCGAAVGRRSVRAGQLEELKPRATQELWRWLDILRERLDPELSLDDRFLVFGATVSEVLKFHLGSVPFDWCIHTHNLDRVFAVCCLVLHQLSEVAQCAMLNHANGWHTLANHGSHFAVVELLDEAQHDHLALFIA